MSSKVVRWDRRTEHPVEEEDTASYAEIHCVRGTEPTRQPLGPIFRLY